MSHVNMGTGPSGQDDSQMEVFAKAGIPWVLRGIANKKGDIRFDLYIYEYGCILKDLGFEIQFAKQEGEDPRRTFWKGQIKERVKPLHLVSKPATGGTAGAYQGGYRGGYDGDYGYGYRHDYGTYKGRSRHNKSGLGKFSGKIFGAVASGTVPGGSGNGNPAAGGAGAGTPAGTSVGSQPSTVSSSPTGIPGGRAFDGEFGEFGGE